jgi:FlaG/FlaF family flagellin (archaellin)
MIGIGFFELLLIGLICVLPVVVLIAAVVAAIVFGGSNRAKHEERS